MDPLIFASYSPPVVEDVSDESSDGENSTGTVQKKPVMYAS